MAGTQQHFCARDRLLQYPTPFKDPFWPPHGILPAVAAL
jgi:hypothetical protein